MKKYQYFVLRPMFMALCVLFSSNIMAQIMVSYDGNENRDMVKEIKYTMAYDVSVFYEFIYNDDRTLKTVTITGAGDKENGPFKIENNYIWQDDVLRVSSYYGVDLGDIVYSLDKNHNVLKCISDDNEYEDYNYTFDYDDNGYINSFFNNVKGKVKWENENIIEYVWGDYKREMTYSNIKNNTNMDFAFNQFFKEIFTCLPIGKWSKMCPVNIKESYGGSLVYNGDLSYSYDSKGRIVKIITDAVEYNDGGVYTYQDIMEISYYDNIGTSIENTTSDGGKDKIYNINGNELQNLQRGLNIIKTNKGIKKFFKR